jgi:hypothetical protein
MLIYSFSYESENRQFLTKKDDSDRPMKRDGTNVAERALRAGHSGGSPQGQNDPPLCIHVYDLENVEKILPKIDVDTD